MLSHRAVDEVIADVGVCVEPTVDALAKRLDAALGGARPPTSPAEHARKYDWDAIAEQAETPIRERSTVRGELLRRGQDHDSRHINIWSQASEHRP
ncbi:hypothetical protein [Halorubrum sp. AS12]|uniref:hypothetical protein n=1 Tax=Halorubrum sp. AS12 TaxID=3409687 RepID=UPI003DA724A3